MSDYKGAAMMVDALPSGKAMFGDRGYDADGFRKALAARGIAACVPERAAARCRSPTTGRPTGNATKIENMFGRLKDWRRIHTRYDRCAHTFMFAIAIAATVILWLDQ